VKDPTAAVRLRQTQNADGGWGYFPGKQSWLEPTFYAAVALEGDPAADRAWTLLKSWQGADGGWRPSREVEVPTWATSLCVTLAQSRGEFGEPFQKGVAWLLDSAGIEGPLWRRLVFRTGLLGKPDRNLELIGWPWKPDTASWVEPTAHAIVALKQAASKAPSAKLQERVRIGQAQLLDVRCQDGGWNYGNHASLHVDLVAFPETTGLALIGLQGHPDLGPSIDLATRMSSLTPSPLARAWLTIALRLHEAQVPPSTVDIVSTPETMIAALSIIAEDKVNFFRTGAVT
jgi:prenyltransferase/squalene oxidase-like repeat protein